MKKLYGNFKAGIVAQDSNLCTQEAKARRS